ncbi:serine hydrolase domain-containing protein [Criblamydia sequanensis]|uniref:Beta-lactamase n=1 Tax=Candidatus Criblamydia sequanensis CRIB-18 TaxID=1437425 RepID=A0A090E2J5_9BACT|nr:serine hydrolase domain-containing protein [Criblamydia sequanensis]CDR34869.1 Beta-lactamase [Criblamydia sequanensis CRIB-18]
MKFFYTFLFSILTIVSHATQIKEGLSKKHELTQEDLDSFFDTLIPSQIEEAHIAGAVIAVVKDGALLFTKGYGFADVAKKAPISPEQTLFRTGSISKLFVWTAVMQLVEQGKLELDRNINDYLDFKVPNTFDKPITLSDIMTHRSGFEESFKDLMVKSPEDLYPLSQYLPSHLPNRIFPPGLVPAYSNYATTLAAYIVERISKQNFYDYIEEHIFKPLTMSDSTFLQPLPEAFKASNGYLLASDDSKPFELLQVGPAGALSTSAIDMSRFMIMHLQKGRFGNAEILKPETIQQMHKRQAGWPSSMNAMCLGFYEQSRNGHRIIGHEGNTSLFRSNIFLIIGANTGLFISYNSAGKFTLDPREVLFDKFMNRYFPDKSMILEPFEETSNIQDVVGSYEPSRRSETTFLRLFKLFQELKVAANLQDNILSVSGLTGLKGSPLHFREIAPMVFQEIDGKAKIAFSTDYNGKKTAHITYDTFYPTVVFQQIPNLLDKQIFNYSVLGFSLIIVLLTLLTWPIVVWVRKHYNITSQPKEKGLRKISYLVCLCIAGYVIGMFVFASQLTDFSMLSKRSDLALRVLQGIALTAILGSLTFSYNCFISWNNQKKEFFGKIWNTLLACAFMGFSWFLFHWNLIDFWLRY